MPSLLGPKFNGAVAKPMAPFFFAALVVTYGVNAFAETLAATDEYKNDPRNPRVINAGTDANKH